MFTSRTRQLHAPPVCQDIGHQDIGPNARPSFSVPPRRGTPIARGAGTALALMLAAACGRLEQLPPENPKEAPDERAPMAPIIAPDAPKDEKPEAKQPKAEPTTITDIGLATPESVLHEPNADIYLVSNINGKPLDKDGNGFISKIKPDGSVDTLKFIDGEQKAIDLNAPKGMALRDGSLYVADIDVVRKFELASGKVQASMPVPGATFLNDLALAPDGNLYLSDSGLKAGKQGFEPTGSDAIYWIGSDDQVNPVIKDPKLGGPNGVLATEDGLWAVTFREANLFSVKAGKQAETQALPHGGLDGIQMDDQGRVLISSWQASAVYRGKPGEDFEAVVENAASPADFLYDAKRNRLVIPLFTKDALMFAPLP